MGGDYLSEYNQNDLKSTLTYIKIQFGVETLCDSKHLFAYLADLAPTLTKERKMIQRLLNIGVLEDFSKTDTSDEALEKRTLAKWSLKLTEEEYIIPEIVNQYLDILAEVFGWQARISLPKPKEESNANSVYTPNSPGALSPVTVYQSAAVSNLINNNTRQTTTSVTQNLSNLKKSTQNLSDFRFYDVPNGVELTDYFGYGKRNVTVPSSYKGKPVVSIGDRAFLECESIETIYLPDSITKIGRSAFRLCTNLNGIFIPKGVTVIKDSTFSGCKSLEWVILPDSLESINKYAFFNCISLEDIELPSTLKKKNIADTAFKGCDNLVISRSKKSPPKKTQQTPKASYVANSNAYPAKPNFSQGLSEFEFINVPNGVKLKKYNQVGKSLVVIPEKFNGKSVVSIGAFAFHNCITVENINMPDSVTTIDDYSFACCKALKNIVIPDSVTRIGKSAFSCCEKLESVHLPNGLTEISDYSFTCCFNLKKIKLPKNLISIGEEAFPYCTNIENIDSLMYLQNIGKNAFQGCNKLVIKEPISNQPIKTQQTPKVSYVANSNANPTKTNFSQGLSEFEFIDVTNGVELKKYNEVGKSLVVIPEKFNGKSVVSIGAFAFHNCITVENINMPDSVTTIDDSAFACCKALKSIVIPNSVIRIGENAFSCCEKLENIDIPYSVTYISESAFWGCANLKTINIENIDLLPYLKNIENHAFIHSDLVSQQKYEEASLLLNDREFAQAALLFGKLGDYKDSYEKSRFAFIRGGYSDFFAFTYQSAICLNSKGEIEGNKSELFGYCKGDDDSKKWYNLVSIYNESSNYGLKSHGKVLMNYSGYNNNYRDISLWSDIVSISVRGSHIVGLKSDGTVVEVGEDKKYTCDNSSNWKDIVSVKTLYNKTIALTKYGSVVTTDSFTSGFIRSMNDIIEIDTDDSTSISVLKRDGTVITNSYQFEAINSRDGWNGIVSISMTRDILIGLRKDGTVVFDRADKIFQKNLSSWKNIIYISAYSVQGKPLVIGLTYKGDIVADGESSEKLLNLIKGKEIFSKSDIEAFRLNFHERKNYLDKLENEIQYNKAVNLFNNNQFENAVLIFKELGSYKDSSDKLEFALNEVYKKAITLLEKRQFVQAALLFGKLGDYKDSVQKSRYTYIRSGYGNYFGNSLDNFLYLDRSGIPNCLSALDSFYIIFAGNCDKSEWKNLASILLKSTHSVGLKTDGTVLVSYDDQCYTGNVSSWKDIVQISAYSNHTVGLRADGTVVATGDNDYNQCNVYSWENIVFVLTASNKTIGLKSDGSVVETSSKYSTGQSKLASWKNEKDIISIVSDGYDFVGLKKDGTVIFDSSYYDYNTSNWNGIVSIAMPCKVKCLLALRKNGRVLITGKDTSKYSDVISWRNIIYLSEFNGYVFGIQSDGKIVLSGSKADRFLDFIKDKEVFTQSDIEAFKCNFDERTEFLNKLEKLSSLNEEHNKIIGEVTALHEKLNSYKEIYRVNERKLFGGKARKEAQEKIDFYNEQIAKTQNEQSDLEKVINRLQKEVNSTS